jgi:cyanophycinase-like exopeptidase
VVGVAGATPATADVVRYLTGNPRDAAPRLYGPAQYLGGGGADVQPALQSMIDQVRGCSTCGARLDVVVLRTSGADGYNLPLYALNGVDSVETLVVTARADADRPDVESTVRNAEIVLFAEGDPCAYLQVFRGTRVELAVEHVYRRWGGVGGAGAGAAIQGPLIYDACTGDVLSDEALADPFHAGISFSSGFFGWDFFDRLLVDTRLTSRDRMGRLLAFLARQMREGRGPSAWGVGLDEATSVVTDHDGRVRVLGLGSAYFAVADHLPETCEPGLPLTYSNFRIWRVAAGGGFDLRYRPTTGSYGIDVEQGKLTADPY